MLTAIGSETAVLNPCIAAVNWYCPAARLLNSKWPAVSDFSSRVCFWAISSSVIRAPGITAPVGSTTVPSSQPGCANWAHAEEIEVVNNSRKIHVSRREFIVPPVQIESFQKFEQL